ncbi:MAG: glycosyltransferase family 2 protein [Maricaulaceae bacterium]
MSAAVVTLTASAATAAETPELSVLIPFFRDDPCDLVDRLNAQIGGLADPQAVELALYDDGSGDEGLTARVAERVSAAPGPARLFTGAPNAGRSTARNELSRQARAGYHLYLDADMAPDAEDFLARWLSVIEAHKPAAAFGGFSVAQIACAPQTALHYALAASSEALPAAIRNRYPAKHLCTSNLLVRSDIMAAYRFDEGFKGWGWEDVEWAARVAADHTVTHIDNPATHFGLEPAERLLAKFQASGPNFARLIAKHPALKGQLPVYRAAQLIKRLPGARLAKPIWASLARGRVWPVRLRLIALKLWRASWYAEALP